MEKYRIPIKLRLCDTLGFGVIYPNSTLPRSIPKIIYELKKNTGFTSDLLEWHGHNDFHKSVINASTAWLYGVSGNNCSLFGIGERTGNTPLEAMIIEYAQFRGTLDGMNTNMITKIAQYFSKEKIYTPPQNFPFVGKNFNTTQAGIHVDGLQKNESIYNIFDTQKILNRPPVIAISNTSGLSSIAYWINKYFNIPEEESYNKSSPLVYMLKKWIDKQYENGRTTTISDIELANKLYSICSEKNLPFPSVKTNNYTV